MKNCCKHTYLCNNIYHICRLVSSLVCCLCTMPRREIEKVISLIRYMYSIYVCMMVTTQKYDFTTTVWKNIG